jgi:hypothetical protein
MNIQSVRDIVIINTPAINSLEFKNINYYPRAARFSYAIFLFKSGSKTHSGYLQFYEPFLFIKITLLIERRLS